MSDGDINAIDGLACLVVSTLVDDGVDGDGGLSCLAITDDEFTLSTTNRNHGIHGLESCLQRFVDGLTEDNARRFTFQWHVERLTSDGSLAVDGVSEGINHTSHHTFTDGDGGNASCSFHDITLFDAVGRSEQYSTYVVFLKVHHDGFHAIVEGKQFACLSVAKSIGTHHSVADGQYGTHLNLVAEGVLFVVYVGELLTQHRCHFAYFYGIGHNSFLMSSN